MIGRIQLVGIEFIGGRYRGCLAPNLCLTHGIDFRLHDLLASRPRLQHIGLLPMLAIADVTDQAMRCAKIMHRMFTSKLTRNEGAISPIHGGILFGCSQLPERFFDRDHGGNLQSGERDLWLLIYPQHSCPGRTLISDRKTDNRDK